MYDLSSKAHNPDKASEMDPLLKHAMMKGPSDYMDLMKAWQERLKRRAKLDEGIKQEAAILPWGERQNIREREFEEIPTIMTKVKSISTKNFYDA